MKGKTIRVLLIEDSPIDGFFVQGCLSGTANPAFQLQTADRLSNGLAQLEAGGIDALLLDLCLPDSEGLASFKRAQAAAPGIPIVVMSGDTDEELAVEAVQAGAQDYMVKGRYDRELLTRSLRYAIERKRTQLALSDLAQRLTYHVSNSPLAVIEWGANLDVIRWSDEAERMFGWSFEQVRGKRWDDFPFVYLEDKQRFSQVFADLCAGTTPKCFSANRNYRADGSVVHCEWYSSSLMDSVGRLRSILSLVLDVSDRKDAEERLRLANRQLHQLSTDLLRSQDDERRRIARELHDSTAQTLAALDMSLRRLQKPGIELPRKQALLAEAIDLVAASSREIRTLSYLLHPPLLDEIGLATALRAYTDGFHQRTGIFVELKISPDFGRLDDVLELALFRIVQEGLANVHRHSGSPVAIIRLEKNITDIRLVVQDRGRGLPAEFQSPDHGVVGLGVGMLGMRARAEELGGRLQIESSTAGTRVAVNLPLGVNDGEAAHIGS